MLSMALCALLIAQNGGSSTPKFQVAGRPHSDASGFVLMYRKVADNFGHVIRGWRPKCLL